MANVRQESHRKSNGVALSLPGHFSYVVTFTGQSLTMTKSKANSLRTKQSGPSETVRSSITIRGARVHNLKNISLSLPRNKLIVVTGVSGSGKSSLAFDTLYAEGQRRYVESLSSYARQFLERMEKPDVDQIEGISPAIAIEQKTTTRNPRSTVGTTTELYDYLRLLFGRVGRTYCRSCGKEVRRDTVSTIVDRVLREPEGTKLYVLFPMHEHSGRSLKEELSVLKQRGFFRIMVDDQLIDLNEKEFKGKSKKNIAVVVDRLVNRRNDAEAATRLADSVQTAFAEGGGYAVMNVPRMACDMRIRNRGSSPSTAPSAPVPHVRDSVARWGSTWISSFPTRRRRSAKARSSRGRCHGGVRT
jgi:excinuclease ABC A subunit